MSLGKYANTRKSLRKSVSWLTKLRFMNMKLDDIDETDSEWGKFFLVLTSCCWNNRRDCCQNSRAFSVKSSLIHTGCSCLVGCSPYSQCLVFRNVQQTEFHLQTQTPWLQTAASKTKIIHMLLDEAHFPGTVCSFLIRGISVACMECRVSCHYRQYRWFGKLGVMLTQNFPGIYQTCAQVLMLRARRFRQKYLGNQSTLTIRGASNWYIFAQIEFARASVNIFEAVIL